MHVIHSLKPIYDEHSQVLILGTMPSQTSRTLNFYYSHPQNRFWPTLARLFNESIGNTNESRKDFLLRHKIALFDVLQSCDIEASNDNTIKKPIPNDLTPILTQAHIKAIFTTGKKAYALYNKYIFPKTQIKAIPLPSTSPANSPKNINDILDQTYSTIKEYLD